MPPLQSHLEKLGNSYAHITREFKKHYGITPMQYINSAKIERAKLLLKDTSLNIGEIAERVGFESLPCFSRIFQMKHNQWLNYLN